MPSGMHDFMVNGVKQDSTQISFGPFNTMSEAQQFGDDQMASGNFVSYDITAKDSHGNTVEYDND